MALPLRACALALPLTLLLAACEQPPAPPPPAPASTGPAQRASAPVVPATPPPVASAAPAPPPVPDIPAPADVAAPPAGAQKTASGLVSNVLTPGKGKDHPALADTVKVNYVGWSKDGKMFDASSTHGGAPATFRVDGVIKGWTEALQLMVVGEKRRLWIPAALAYGEKPAMPGAPAGDLTFDVELLDLTVAPKPPPVPTDVKAAPPGAKKTASGLAYRVIKAGTGTAQPKATDTVTVNYSGWTPDGKMFDSSITRGTPTSFPLNHVIKGWTEGVQLMKVGDTMRFWIPSDLAYGDKPTRPGAPVGPLVFDIELISIGAPPRPAP